jgi:DNA-binding CsgD family transcriptional regulator/tetratricopeptide (TPR) repeat protein
MKAERSTMATTDLLERGRDAYDRRAWADAYAWLEHAASGVGVGPEDLVRLAMAAVLTGHDEQGCDLLGRAHQEYLALGDVERAVRCAFWAGMVLGARGSVAPASGWLARAERAALSEADDSLVHGILRIPAARAALLAGDLTTAEDLFARAHEIAARWRDADLLALSRLGLGTIRVLRGDVDEGCRLLDEVMASVTLGEVSPLPAGIVYCAVIDVCRQTLDVRRAREWTDALTRWCDGQPGLVPFRGECLVHRSEVALGRDDWDEALLQAERAVALLSDRPGPVLGLALYQLGEVRRLRGEPRAAEAAYRAADQHGFDEQPGLALLFVEEGRLDAAATMVRRLLGERRPGAVAARLLATAVEVLLAAGDADRAAQVADELDAVAGPGDAHAYPRALADRARGAVLLARRDPEGALERLRRSLAAWQELDMPYEAARTRALVGLARRDLGDEDGALADLDAARWSFARLGALPDVARVDRLAGGGAAAGRGTGAGGVTARELDVLRLVAEGGTNRAIAAALHLSEKTVARHLSNIYAKLGLPSRAAATAYAYEHGLVGRDATG